MQRVSNLILFVLVFTLAATDWFSVPTIAQPQAANRQAPNRVPAAAMLTGATLRSATVDGLDVELDGVPGEGFVLALHNPSSRPRVAHFEVDCVQRTGSLISRMGPIPRVVHTQRIEVTVPAHASVRQRLEADVSPPVPDPDADPAAMEIMSVTTTSFRLREAGAESNARPLAELHWPTASAVDAG